MNLRDAVLLLATLLVTGCGVPPLDIPVVPVDEMQPRVASTLTEARDAVRAEPLSAEAWGRLGAVFHAHRRLAEAERCYQEARRLDPGDFRWAYFLAIVGDASDSGSEEVAARFRAANELRPDYAAVHLRAGQAMFRRGAIPQARDAFSRALALNEDEPVAHRGIGQCAMAGGSLEEAVTRLERAAALRPEDGATQVALAQVYRATGRPVEAEEAARKSVELAPVHAIRDPVFEREVYERGVSADLCWQRANAAIRAGQWEDAIRDLKIAAETRVDDPAIERMLGNCYGKLRDGDRALSHLERSLALDPDQPRTRVQVAILLDAMRRSREALEQFRIAAADPGADSGVLSMYASALLRGGRVDHSLVVFASALERGTLDARAHLNYGTALMNRGRPREAIPQLERALELEPGYAQAHANLALLFERLGDVERSTFHRQAAAPLASAGRR